MGTNIPNIIERVNKGQPIQPSVRDLIHIHNSKSRWKKKRDQAYIKFFEDYESKSK